VEGDRRRTQRDRDSRHGRSQGEEQRQQQWDVRESGGVAEQSYRQRDRSPDDLQRRSVHDKSGHGPSRGSSRCDAGVNEARPSRWDREGRDRDRAAAVPVRQQERAPNDVDIEQWLDSLFTAVPASGTA
jgi:hypothetical protein